MSVTDNGCMYLKEETLLVVVLECLSMLLRC